MVAQPLSLAITADHLLVMRSDGPKQIPLTSLTGSSVRDLPAGELVNFDNGRSHFGGGVLTIGTSSTPLLIWYPNSSKGNAAIEAFRTSLRPRRPPYEPERTCARKSSGDSCISLACLDLAFTCSLRTCHLGVKALRPACRNHAAAIARETKDEGPSASLGTQPSVSLRRSDKPVRSGTKRAASSSRL